MRTEFRPVQWLAVAALLEGSIVGGCGALGAPTRTSANGSPVAVVDQDCATRLRPLYDKAQDLSSRLNVGLTQSAYNDKLGDVRVTYDAVVRGGALPTGACFDTGKKLETALNEFVTADNRWTACIADVNCTVKTDALPEMQTHWATASRLIDEVALALP